MLRCSRSGEAFVRGAREACSAWTRKQTILVIKLRSMTVVTKVHVCGDIKHEATRVCVIAHMAVMAEHVPAAVKHGRASDCLPPSYQPSLAAEGTANLQV